VDADVAVHDLAVAPVCEAGEFRGTTDSPEAEVLDGHLSERRSDTSDVHRYRADFPRNILDFPRLGVVAELQIATSSQRYVAGEGEVAVQGAASTGFDVVTDTVSAGAGMNTVVVDATVARVAASTTGNVPATPIVRDRATGVGEIQAGVGHADAVSHAAAAVRECVARTAASAAAVVAAGLPVAIGYACADSGVAGLARGAGSGVAASATAITSSTSFSSAVGGAHAVARHIAGLTNRTRRTAASATAVVSTGLSHAVRGTHDTGVSRVVSSATLSVASQHRTAVSRAVVASEAVLISAGGLHGVDHGVLVVGIQCHVPEVAGLAVDGDASDVRRFRVRDEQVTARNDLPPGVEGLHGPRIQVDVRVGFSGTDSADEASLALVRDESVGRTEVHPLDNGKGEGRHHFRSPRVHIRVIPPDTATTVTVVHHVVGAVEDDVTWIGRCRSVLDSAVRSSAPGTCTYCSTLTG